MSSAVVALTHRRPMPRAVKYRRCAAEEEANQKLILVLASCGLIKSVRLSQSVTPLISYNYLNVTLMGDRVVIALSPIHGPWPSMLMLNQLMT